MRFKTIVTLKITEDVPDELVSRPYSHEEFCENLKEFIKSELYETGQVEILEDVVPVVHGHWDIDEDGNMSCSECGHAGSGRYCSHCGATMEGDV